MHFRWVNEVRPQWYCACGVVCDSPPQATKVVRARRPRSWRDSFLTGIVVLIFVLLL
jgi:hypothetical protein